MQNTDNVQHWDASIISPPAIQPLVSIIIPTYNYGGYICGALDSCITQTYSNIEVIVVDDGSTDNTAEVVRGYVENFPSQFRYIKQQNRGVSAARNTGLKRASGDFITFLDSDDCLTPDGLEIRLQAFREHPDIGVVLTEKYDRYDGDDRLYYGPRIKRNYVSDTLYLDLLQRKVPSAVTQSLILTPLARKASFPEFLMSGEDTVYLVKMFMNAKACVLRQPTIIVHYHEGSGRHDGASVLAKRQKLVETLFSDPELGPALEPVRQDFTTREYFHIFKQLYKSAMYREAGAHYIKAIAVRPLRNLLMMKPLLRFIRLNVVLAWRRLMTGLRR